MMVCEIDFYELNDKLLICINLYYYYYYIDIDKYYKLLIMYSKLIYKLMRIYIKVIISK